MKLACKMKWISLVALWIWTTITPGNAENCPQYCLCLQGLISCQDARTSTVPVSNVTRPDVLVLFYNGTSVRSIKAQNFINYPNLLNIIFAHNAIEVIEPNAFCGLNGLRNLRLNSNGLKRINNDTFACLPYLKILNMDYNDIDAIESRALCGLKNLETLHLTSNNLKSIPQDTFSCLTTLKFLYLDYNGVGVIDPKMFCGLNYLKTLSLTGNQIKKVSNETLAYLDSLTTLNLGFNDIDTLDNNPFCGIKGLQFLQLTSNKIKILRNRSLTCLQSLLFLSLDHNSIDTVEEDTFSGLRQLIKLDLSANLLRRVPSSFFRDLTSLIYLDLDYNLIESIEPKSFCGINRLQTLLLNGNKIKEIKLESSLACLSSLHTLNLQHNFISRIDSRSFCHLDKLAYLFLQNNFLSKIDSGDFDCLPQLKTLRLSFNSINTIAANSFCGAQMIQELLLEGNELKELHNDSFACLSSLTNLDIDFAKLETIHPRTFCPLSSIVDLHLEGNRLTELWYDSLACLGSITGLSLNGNNIQELPPRSFETLISLKTLEISNCELTVINEYQFIGLISLEKLVLRSNNIHTILKTAFDGLDALQRLDLTDNALFALNSTTFQNLTALQELYLDENTIKNLEAKQFENLSNLRFLSLKTNGIVSVHPEAFFGLHNLKRLQLDGNRIINIKDLKLPDALTLDILSLSKSNLQNLAKFETLLSNVTVKIMDLSDNLFHENTNFHFYDYQSLNLSYNFLQEDFPLNFSNIPSLRHLDLTGNRYRHINERFMAVSKGSIILSINISSNSLESIEADTFKSLAELNSLYLRNNYLTKMTFIRPLSKLSILSLGRNNFKTLDKEDFMNLTDLRELYLDNNRIGYLRGNYFENIQLTTLSLENNMISSVVDVFTNSSSLKTLNLNSNLIENIDNIFHESMAQVNAIYLRDNRIKAWSGGPFRHSPILAILDLSENLLTEVSDLGLASMSQLNLQGNEINYLSCRGLPTALKSLNLAYNNIKKIDSDCDTLFQQINEFDISFNNLVSNGMNIKESVLDKLKQILVLNIAGNNITRIRHKTTFNQYRRLNISYNPMTLTELSEFMGRGTSYLMMIDISSLKFEQLPDEYWRFYQILRILHIKDNGLKELNYANRTRYDNNVVLELDVSGNKMNNFFSSIEARLVSLEKLNVARNGISDICYRSLAIQFPVIQILDARMNKIDRLQRRCFKGMGKLRVLLLQDNNLAYVSGKSFYGPPEMVTVLTKRDYLCCMVPAKIKLCQPSMGSDDLSSCENLLSHFSQKLFIWIVGILAVVGNLLVFIQNHSIRKQKNSLVPIFLINSLALSDLLMAFYLIIIIVADLAFSTGEYGLNSEIWLSSPFCLIACFLVNASSLTTVLLMVTICSDRYICLVYPLSPKRMSIKTARIVVVFVWILSLSFAAAPVISSANMPGYLRLYTYNSMCMANNYQIDYYRVWMISYLSIIFIAWVAMTILYMRLFMTIRRSGKNLRRSTATDNTVIAIRLALILISDLISWVPFYYVNLHGLLTSGRVDVIALQFVGIFSLPINSAINPYLYTFTNIDIIKKFLVRQKTFSTKS